MPYEYDNPLANTIHGVLGEHELPEMIAALLKVTVDVIHHTEGREFREKLEAAYIKALTYVSAVEEQAQASTHLFEDADETEKEHLEELFGRIMYRLFIGGDNREPMRPGHEPIVPEQIRAARELLGWSQQRLADKAKLPLEAVVQLEQGKGDALIDALSLVHRALTTAGVEFLSADIEGAGCAASLAASMKGSHVRHWHSLLSPTKCENRLSHLVLRAEPVERWSTMTSGSPGSLS
jgi:transcriptional regulator with XRE-family HTH domain